MTTLTITIRHRPADCPGDACQNRNSPHSVCRPRRCIGPKCTNRDGLYCHAHESWCSSSVCSCKPRECVDTTGIQTEGLYCHVHHDFCPKPHCQCGKQPETGPTC